MLIEPLLLLQLCLLSPGGASWAPQPTGCLLNALNSGRNVRTRERSDSNQGRSQDFTLGITEAERRRRENRGVKIGEGYPPAGSGVQPPTHFWHIWGPQNTSGGENSYQFFPVKNPLNRRLGACLPLATPLIATKESQRINATFK